MIAGEQLVVPHVEGARYFDLWNGTSLNPRVIDGQAFLETTLEGRGFGALLALCDGIQEEGLDDFLAQMKKEAATPLA